MATNKTYADGLREGEVMGLHRRLDKIEDRQDNHSKRLRYMERIQWGIIGAAVLINIGPQVGQFFGKFMP